MSEKRAPGRRSREELRELVMSAAIELIRSEGLRAVSTTLTYQRVFDYLEDTRGVRITRASVHERIWPSQHEFQLAVLIGARPWSTTGGITTEPALEAFSLSEGLAPLDRMREMVRAAAGITQLSADEDALYYSWVGMTMTMARDPSMSTRDLRILKSAVTDSYDEITGTVIDVLQALAVTLGLRPRRDIFGSPSDGWPLIVKLGTALSEGATVRTRFDADELPDVILNTGPDGEPQVWSAFAAGYWALLQTFLEVDPAVHPDRNDDA